MRSRHVCTQFQSLWRLKNACFIFHGVKKENKAMPTQLEMGQVLGRIKWALWVRHSKFTPARKNFLDGLISRNAYTKRKQRSRQIWPAATEGTCFLMSKSSSLISTFHRSLFVCLHLLWVVCVLFFLVRVCKSMSDITRKQCETFDLGLWKQLS